MDNSFCGLTNEETCIHSAAQFKIFYSAAKGNMNTTACQMFYSGIPFGGGWNSTRVCNTIADVMKGRAQPPAKFAEYFKFMSGKISSCADLKGQAKYDCVLMADMMAGINSGVSRYWLYDALTKKDCSKVDYALVDKYCGNEITKNAPVTKNRKKSGKDAGSGE